MALLDFLKPNTARKPFNFKLMIFITLLVLAGLWIVGKLFQIANIPAIGPVLLVALIIVMIVFAYKLTENPLGASTKDFILLGILTVVILVILIYGKQYVPELFSAAATKIKMAVIP
jgi:predicted ferric reductase